MRSCLVLDNFQATQPCALIATASDEKSRVRRRRDMCCAYLRRRGVGVEIVRDTDCMTQYHSVSIYLLVNINASHELDELAYMSALMRALGINRLSDQMDRHRIIL